MSSNVSPDQTGPIQLLARSAFALVFLATLAALIVLPFLLAAPVPDLAAIQSARSVFLVIYAAVLVFLLIACWLLLRIEPKRLVPSAQKIARLLSRRVIAIPLTLALIEINFLVFILLNQIAPGITGPLKFLLACWTLIAFAVLAVVNGRALSRWFAKTQRIWIGIGVASVIVVAGLLVYVVNAQALQNSRLLDELRAATDYRAFPFFGESKADPELSRNFLVEFSRFKLRWQPYTYWVMQQGSGQYINVDSNGLRRTASFVAEDEDAPRIFFFGGSTLWGEGSRDDYTIPSAIARLLHESGQPTHVYNFGQTGYVSTQDVILFMLQLVQGNIPDVAVFYGGFNDTLSSYGHNGIVGLPLSEINRARDFYTGRLLDSGQMVLRPPADVRLEDFDWSLAATVDATPEAVLDRYLANMHIAQTLADAYGVKVLVVWQPASFDKAKQTPEEAAILRADDARYPSLNDFYRAVDENLRKRTAGNDDFLILSGLFRDHAEQVFIDVIHITENGNAAVAQAIAPALTSLLQPR